MFRCEHKDCTDCPKCNVSRFTDDKRARKDSYYLSISYGLPQHGLISIVPGASCCQSCCTQVGVCLGKRFFFPAGRTLPT